MGVVVVRKARKDDRLRAMRILAHWNMAPRAPTPHVPDPERSALILENTFVALADNTLIGVASYIVRGRGYAETASLAVDPGWLGARIGERLQIARLEEMKSLGVVRVQTESDRAEIIDWYLRKFGYRIIGTARKRHDFGLREVDYWTVLELDLRNWCGRTRSSGLDPSNILAKSAAI